MDLADTAQTLKKILLAILRNLLFESVMQKWERGKKKQ